MTTWYTPGPVQVPDNAQQRETVLYGPKGEPLVVKGPRSVGFRPPVVAPTLPTGTAVTVTTPAGEADRVETV